MDLIASTQHDRFVVEDYDRLRRFGIQTVREGLRWHLIESCPSKYDFGSVRPMMDAAKKFDIQVIWDLLHFGWPGRLDIFHPSWVQAFGEFALEFARFWKQESGGQRVFIAPVNEISFLSWAGGDCGFLNPFVQGRGDELKAQLVRGAVQAVRAVRSELSEVTVIAPEPVIHIAGDPSVPGDVDSAEAYRLSMYQSWDMLSGRLHPELGGTRDVFDVLGINYYDRNQWWNHGPTIHVGDPAYRPFHEILAEVFDRYRCPMFIAETGTEDEARPFWFAYIAGEVRKAIAAGVLIQGICLYPILNHPGWDDDRHCRNGLWDYAGEDGFRELYQPLADEIRKQEDIRAFSNKENINE